MIEFFKPMLATELTRPFDNKEWLFEANRGGYRAISVVQNGKANIYSHKHQLYNADFPLLIKELEKLPYNAVMDGEIVLLNEEGNPDIQKLQNFNEYPGCQICYYVFDLLSFQDQSLFKVPLIERKEKLRQIIGDMPDIRYVDHVVENGCDLFQSLAKSTFEGIAAKKMDSFYSPGKKSQEWIKIRHKNSQEVFICGFTKPSGNRKKIGTLIAGFKEREKFCYSGHVVIGRDDTDIQELYGQLMPLVTEESPFNSEIKSNDNITWVQPVIKCEVKYLDLSKDHLMLYPVLLTVKKE